jgi:hypothetical protein
MNTQYSRILTKRTSTTGIVPTIPSSDSHLDGSWRSTDLYDGELFINTTDKRIWYRSGDAIIEIVSGASRDNGFGSIRIVGVSDTVYLPYERQNFVYGTLNVQGTFSNDGEIVIQEGDLFIAGDGEVIGKGDVIITK